MNPIQCTACNEAGHHMRRCPTLASPLKDGFYAPPPGARQSGGDDDDSSAKDQALSSITPWGCDADDESCKFEKPVYPVLGIFRRKCLKHKQTSKLVKL